MSLGEKLKEARATHKFTQQAVAEQVNVSRQTISSWETGKSYPDLDSLITLSNLYGISLDVLIKGDDGLRDYLRKPEILQKLRPIHQAMLVLNALFLVILTFFLPSDPGIWILLAAVVANTIGYLYLQQFEEQLSPLPRWEYRWRNAWLPSLISNLIVTATLIATRWLTVSPDTSQLLGSLTAVGWFTLASLWVDRVVGRLRVQEAKTAKQKQF